jgi:hypothetical protein
MARSFRWRTGVVVLGVLAILTMLPVLASAEEEYVYFDFCQCIIWVP